MFSFDAIWSEVFAGLQSSIVQIILEFVTGLFEGVLPQG